MIYVLHFVSSWAHTSTNLATDPDPSDPRRVYYQQSIIYYIFHENTRRVREELRTRFNRVKWEANDSAKPSDHYSHTGGGRVIFECEQEEARRQCIRGLKIRTFPEQNRIYLVMAALKYPVHLLSVLMIAPGKVSRVLRRFFEILSPKQSRTEPNSDHSARIVTVPL